MAIRCGPLAGGLATAAEGDGVLVVVVVDGVADAAGPEAVAVVVG
jgi:hypothetical protein